MEAQGANRSWGGTSEVRKAQCVGRVSSWVAEAPVKERGEDLGGTGHLQSRRVSRCRKPHPNILAHIVTGLPSAIHQAVIAAWPRVPRCFTPRMRTG